MHAVYMRCHWSVLGRVPDSFSPVADRCRGSLVCTGRSSHRSDSAPIAVFTQYCVTCHNAKLKTAGLVLDPSGITHAGANAEPWEKVIRKLRSAAMPPPGAPRPDQATYDSSCLVSGNRTRLAPRPAPESGQAAAAASAEPHRISERDSRSAGVDALPKEMDYSLLLPADNSSSGFDNIADLLFVSPTAMERYLDAAREDQPPGGGRSGGAGDGQHLPAVAASSRRTRAWRRCRSARAAAWPCAATFRWTASTSSRWTLRGSRAGIRRRSRSRGWRAGAACDRGGWREPARRGAGAATTNPLEVRIPVKAGPRLVGVTFVERTEARDENVLRPRMRGRARRPRMVNVTISGPYNANGPGDTPSRQRIFVCRPADGADEQPCADRSSPRWSGVPTGGR